MIPNEPLDLPKSYGVVAGSVRRWRRGGPVELATELKWRGVDPV